MTLPPRDAAEVIAGALSGIAGPLGVAVSGGSDSLALLYLLNDWAGPRNVPLHVVTVDHGLRPDAAGEAAFVADVAAQLGLPHKVLRWTGWDGQGNLPDRARRARYALMADWASEAGIGHVAVGHTADDQAETLLMRLARGAGAEGLAAMSPRRLHSGVTFLRPLLSLRRADLRALLTDRGQRWIDDPTNDDLRYDRPRIRQAMPDLAALGLTVEALTTTAANLRAATDTIARYAVQEARAHLRFEAGDILIPAGEFEAMPPEIARRILSAGLRWMSGADYPPRRDALDRLLFGIRKGEGLPLSGCMVLVAGGMIRVTREPAAVAGIAAAPGEVWDGRWLITGPFRTGDHIAATGEAGLRACPDWRNTGLPRATLLSAPAVWRNDALIAAPLAGDATEFSLRPVRSAEDFLATLHAH